MPPARTAALVSAALGFLLIVHPAEGTQKAPLAPRLKGVVIARSEHLLVVDQVLRTAGQPRTVRVILTSRTQVAGRRGTGGAIRIHDLIRAEGVESADGSLEALHVEVVLTAEEISVTRPAPAGPWGPFWEWIRTGSLSFPLP